MSKQSRREFIRTIGLTVASAGGAPLLPGSATAGRGDRPNIIYILADDLGYGDLGCYGQKKIKTPNIDKLAEEGMKFTDHYAGSTVCAPSRCCLMTGLHSGHALIRANGRVPLRPSDVTVAELLKKAGYTTGIIGKWGLGEPDTSGIPNRQGFDYWFGYLNQRHAHNYYPSYLWRNEEKYELKNEVNHNIGGRDRDDPRRSARRGGHQRRTAGNHVDVAGELPRLVNGDDLRLAGRVLGDLDAARLDDVEIEAAFSLGKQHLAVGELLLLADRTQALNVGRLQNGKGQFFSRIRHLSGLISPAL